MWVHDLRDADASCGGKAVGLARLIAAGLNVPPGFAISNEAFRSITGDIVLGGGKDDLDASLGADPAAIGHALAAAAERIANAELPEELEAEVRERAKDLGSLVAVRSSATIEDSAAGAAAGVFSSRRAVPVAEVWNAIRAVWTSALTPLAAAYATRRGARIAIGVIVQEHVPGTPLVVYTQPPGQPTSHELIVQHGGRVSHHSRDDLPREIEAQHAAVLALRAEQAIGADQGADVELVQIRKQHGFDIAIETAIVQARPIVHPAPRVLVPPPPAILASLQDGRTWTWDIAHNPDPLSAAQQGLVERVERAGLAPWSLRVCGGFLYTASRGEELPPITSAIELCRRAVELETTLERTLAGATTSTVTEAIERYLAFYAVWARELAPLIAAARAVLPAAIRRAGGDHVDALAAAMIGRSESIVEKTLFAAARGELDVSDVEVQLGMLAPSWDVAVPTYGERPGLLRDAVERAKAASARPPTGNEPASKLASEARKLGEALAPELEIAKAAAELAERDDLLFARAQHLVRRALVARAAELRIPRDEIFWLPLDEIAAYAAIAPADALRRAGGARAAAERAQAWQMPLVVGGEPPVAGASLHGVGTGPRVAGRVVRFASLASAIAVGPGDVVVTRAVTPALAVLVAGCAALVSETGGYLDHGAALARELGITCVVGCRDAWSQLSDGMLVSVDGDAGTITTTNQSSSS